ncbi:MAG: hypothetical protein JTT11_01370 [Candidatus Brockarchaeota archaeon]|nr:hypothetical protein [Candidatus Brockarchaeota archaeon]
MRVLGHELVCSSCGLVQRNLDVFELPSGAVEGGPRFCGYSPGFAGGPRSKIPRGWFELKDGKGRSIPPHLGGFYSRLGKADSNTRSGSSERRTSRLVWRVSEQLNLPKPVAESAILAYRRSAPKVNGSGITHAALAACCLIYAARGLPRASFSAKEVMEAFARRGVRLRARDVLRAGFLLESGRTVCRSEDYLYRILDKLVCSLDERTLKRCGCEDRFKLLQKLFSSSKKMLEGLGPEARRGRNPLLLASAVVYASTRLLSPSSAKSPISQRIVAIASETMEYSVREAYEGLKGLLHSQEASAGASADGANLA